MQTTIELTWAQARRATTEAAVKRIAMGFVAVVACLPTVGVAQGEAGTAQRGPGIAERGPGIAQRAMDPAQPGAERMVRKQVEVPAALEDVWRTWTTAAGVTSFFAPHAVVDARVGGAFHVHIDPTAPAGLKGADDMRFMALQAPTMLSFDWNAPPSLPWARQQRTLVVVRLTSLGPQRTLVTLHHMGWGDGGEWDKAYAYFDRAWGQVLGNLQKRFVEGPIDWAPWLAQLKQWREAAEKRTVPP